MEDSRQNIALPQGVFVDVYNALTVAIGTKLAIQNQGTVPVVVYIGDTPIDNAGYILSTFEYLTVPASTSKCYVKAVNSMNGLISVQLGAWSIQNAPLDERVYTGLKALTVQSFNESNSKSGTQFEMCYGSANLAPSSNLDLVFSTSSKFVLVKARQISFTGTGIETFVYKGCVATGGDSVPVYNLNTDLLLPTLSSAVINPVVTSVGTEICARTVSYGTADTLNKPIGTFTAEGSERVLSTNSKYLLRVTNRGTTACKLSIHISYYEGEISSLN